MISLLRWIPLVFFAFPLLVTGADQEPTWKAGAASEVITPKGSMWLAGYASRNKPAEGKEQDLFVKAVALESPQGKRVVVMTTDLIGIPRSLAEAVRAGVKKKTGLSRDQLILTISHTHCSPVVANNLSDMYPMPDEELKKVVSYTDTLRDKMIAVIDQAVKNLEPANVSVGKGTARFAVNRRKVTPKGVLNDRNDGGPVDHDVPVLKVESKKGKLVAVVFGYACHNTTMQFYRYCGDYAGFAQEYLEKKYPGTKALFWAGCAGDANPLPRSKIELCKKYGKELADAVSDVVSSKMTPLTGKLDIAYEEIAIPFEHLPEKAKLVADQLSKNRALSKRAEKLLRQLKDNGKIDDHYRHYPVQVCRLGDQVTWVVLGGEVVVDYSLRLKKELAGKSTVWVTGYANDVMAYIPSARVLKEGGYEADSSQIYYGQPSKWAPAIEDLIVRKVHELAKKVGAKPSK